MCLRFTVALLVHVILGQEQMGRPLLFRKIHTNLDMWQSSLIYLCYPWGVITTVEANKGLEKAELRSPQRTWSKLNFWVGLSYWRRVGNIFTTLWLRYTTGSVSRVYREVPSEVGIDTKSGAAQLQLSLWPSTECKNTSDSATHPSSFCLSYESRV